MRSITTLGQLPAELNGIMTALGTTKASLWPLMEATGVLVSGIGAGDLIPSETAGAAEALEDDFAPYRHIGGIHSYHFHPTGDHHLAGIDHGNYSFGDGSEDSAFSLGAFICPNAVNNNTILAKYGSAANLEEWRFFINASGKLSLELHDASESATEIAAGDTTLVAGIWRFVCATYDGVEATPEVLLYLDGGDADNDGTTAETGDYTAMENTATPLTAGCSGVTAAPLTEFHGRIALPFITGKALTSDERIEIYERGVRLLGL